MTMFSNATVMEFTDPFTLTREQLEAKLEKFHFSVPLDGELFKHGFTHILHGTESETVVHEIDGCFFLSYQTAERVLPRGQLSAMVDKRVAELEKKQGSVSKQQRDQLRDSTSSELARQVPPVFSSVHAYIDPKRQIMVVNTKKESEAEDITGLLRRALGSFALRHIRTTYKPCVLLSDWVFGQSSGFMVPEPNWMSVCETGTLKVRGEKASEAATIKGGVIDVDLLKGLKLVQCDLQAYRGEGERRGVFVSFTLVSKPPAKSAMAKSTTDMQLTNIELHDDSSPESGDMEDYFNASAFLFKEQVGDLILKLKAAFSGSQEEYIQSSAKESA